MRSKTTRTLTGYITAVQEQRFRLVTADGQGFLLTLAHQAPRLLDDVHRFCAAQVRVRVGFEGEPNFVSGVAHTIRPCKEEQ